jgi:hypothetical protein
MCLFHRLRRAPVVKHQEPELRRDARIGYRRNTGRRIALLVQVNVCRCASRLRGSTMGQRVHLDLTGSNLPRNRCPAQLHREGTGC